MRLNVRAIERGPAWGLIARLSALVLAVALVLGMACGGDSDDGPGALSNANTTASELANRFIVLLQQNDEAGLDDFLSDAFIIQRANGTFMEKAAYLNDLPEIRDFEITDVTANQAGSTLIVRWSLAVDQTIDGAQFRTDPAPRLSTFVYEDGEWRLAAHANFNVPEADTPAGN